MATGNDKGYKDTKEFICTGCGKTIVLTKFASQKTCKCTECKANNVPTNPDIVAEALAKNPPKERHKTVSTGNTKDRPCIQCGKMVTVSKFMSDAKVLCNECKGVSSNDIQIGSKRELTVDMSKLDRSKIAPIQEYELNQAIIANRKLRYVKCPACGHEHMKPLTVMDWSIFGLILHYQCPKCKLHMVLSEQVRRLLRPYSPANGMTFDYTGAQMEELATTHVEHSRLANSVEILINKCKEHNIPLEGIETPPYMFENDKPVPIGYEIPPKDIWIKAVADTLKSLEEGDTDDAINKLKELLKGEEQNE